MLPASNSTIITLIPQVDSPSSFDDFRPTSLCNVVYKVVNKIISLHLKYILSKAISMEQFGFLEGIQIHEAVGEVELSLKNLKTISLNGIVFKLDLPKPYDRVSQIYLRLLLTHVGFIVDFTLVSSKQLYLMLLLKKILHLFLMHKGVFIKVPLCLLFYLCWLLRGSIDF